MAGPLAFVARCYATAANIEGSRGWLWTTGDLGRVFPGGRRRGPVGGKARSDKSCGLGNRFRRPSGARPGSPGESSVELGVEDVIGVVRNDLDADRQHNREDVRFGEAG